MLTATMAVGLCGCKARPAGRLETAAMEDAKRWVMVGDKHVVNPLPPTAENIAEGKESFSHYCVVARDGRAEHRGAVCGCDVAGGSFAGFAAGAGL